MKISVISMMLFAVLGLILLGQSFSGLVISESCCFGPDCELENLCDSAKLNQETPGQVSNPNNSYALYFGILSLLAAFTALGFYKKL